MQDKEQLPEDFAARVADILMSELGSSGIFLQMPREACPDSFIRRSLLPHLITHHDTHVIYANLEEDSDSGAADVIAAAVREALRNVLAPAAEFARSDAGADIDFEQIGIGRDVTFMQALKVLAAKSQKWVTLIINQVCRTQLTRDGQAALYALKAARDELNLTTGPQFRLLAVDSADNGLRRLVAEHHQAFFCAPLLDAPSLSFL